MLPSADRSYDTFWRQAVRWLAVPATDPIVTHVPAGGSPGDTLPLAITVRNDKFEPQPDATVDLRVVAPDGRMETLRAAARTGGDGAAGQFVAGFRPAQPGVYTVTAEARRGTAVLGASSTSMLVGGADLEMTDPRLNLQLLQRIALASGGRMTEAGDAAALAEALRAGIPAAAQATRRDLWHNAWSFVLIVGLLAVEWGLRRRWGLR
jgi:hypothetical protein